MFCIIIPNDLIDYKHRIHILVLRVISKFSKINETTFDAFVDNDMYQTISSIIMIIIRYIKDHQNINADQNTRENLFETLNYSLYLLYKFSFNTKISLKHYDTMVMIERAKYILSAYLNQESYLNCPKFTPSIILCTLLCFFNNLVTKFSRIDMNNILDEKFISGLIDICNNFVIQKICLVESFFVDYIIRSEVNFDDIRHFDLAEVLKSLNRFYKFLEFLQLNDECKAKVFYFKNSLYSIINENRMSLIIDADALEIQQQICDCRNDINDNFDFEKKFQETMIGNLSADEIKKYLDDLKDNSKTNDGLERLKSKYDFLQFFVERVIKGLNCNFINLQFLYKKESIELIMTILSKIISHETLSGLMNLWFVLLFKIILRQSLYYGRQHPIDKTHFELFFCMLHRNHGYLFDFCEQSNDTNSFELYFNELQ